MSPEIEWHDSIQTKKSTHFFARITYLSRTAEGHCVSRNALLLKVRLVMVESK